MPFRVRIQDFQSIEDATIEVEGLTVLTGPNNSGKTAVCRAIYGAFTNARGTKFVRQGKASTKIELAFSDGHTLLWEKGEKVNRYELDGKALNKVGHGAPPETDVLGVLPVEAAGRELWPQFAHQFVGQVFLLDDPGSVLAEAVANVDKVGVLNESLRLSQSDRRSAAAELKVRNEDVAKYEAAVIKFDGLDNAVSLTQKAETQSIKVAKIQKALEQTHALKERWVLLTGAVQEVLPVRAIPTVADLIPDIQRDQKALEQATTLKTRLDALIQAVQEILPVRSLPTVDNAIAERTLKLQQAIDWARTISNRMQRAVDERDLAVVAVQRAQSLTIPDAQPAIRALRRLDAANALAGQWLTLKSTVGGLVADLAKTRTACDIAESEVRTLFLEAGSCPLCDQSVACIPESHL